MNCPSLTSHTFTSLIVFLSLLGVPKNAQAMEREDKEHTSKRNDSKKRDHDDKKKNVNDNINKKQEDELAPFPIDRLSPDEISLKILSDDDLQKYKELVAKGNKNSMDPLVDHYYLSVLHGRCNPSTEETYSEFPEYVKQAAENGYFFAKPLLGWLYARGKMPGGINEENNKKAIELFRDSVEKSTLSQIYLTCFLAQLRPQGPLRADTESVLKADLEYSRGFVRDEIQHSLKFLDYLKFMDTVYGWFK